MDKHISSRLIFVFVVAVVVINVATMRRNSKFRNNETNTKKCINKKVEYLRHTKRLNYTCQYLFLNVVRCVFLFFFVLFFTHKMLNNSCKNPPYIESILDWLVQWIFFLVPKCVYMCLLQVGDSVSVIQPVYL